MADREASAHASLRVALWNLAPVIDCKIKAELVADQRQLRAAKPANAVEVDFGARSENQNMHPIGKMPGANDRSTQKRPGCFRQPYHVLSLIFRL
ncbi:hypothetical protein AB3Y40_04870 [Yoonia sp. R2331]|uniref:hypothetical protein n=1 Tax=Yoonia sp. R2331 TaxID=3237238 RepID=UPI0034E41F55